MRAGVCQLQIIWENREATFRKVHAFMRQAKSEKIEICFFPEMTLSGFSMNVEKTKDTCTEETISRFRKICKDIGIAAGFGWVEKEQGKKAKNHYSIVSEEGQLLLDYVKIHPFRYGGETKYFEGGNQVQFCSFKGNKIAVAICYDLRFPELFRFMDRDCSLVVIPANWPAARKEHWNCLLQARAIENQVYVMGVNCTGLMNDTYYSGDSTVFNPLGVKLAEVHDKEKLIYIDISNDVEEYRMKFPVLQDQRIDVRIRDNDNSKCMHDSER